jgi:hypothetical protein
MRIELTPDVTHKKNNEYSCVLVQFEPEMDKHYFYDKHNWMPKDVEVMALIELLSTTSRTFSQMLQIWCIKKGYVSYGDKFPMENGMSIIDL